MFISRDHQLLNPFYLQAAAGPADTPGAAVLDLVGAAGPPDMDALKARMIAMHGPAIARMDIDTWKKEPKARLPAVAIKVMRGWWAKHQDSPYPAVGRIFRASSCSPSA